MSKKSRKKPTVIKNKIGMMNMVRDVLIRAIDKGQLLGATLSLMLIIIVLRLPPEDLSELVNSLISGLAKGALLGWGLSVALVLLWYSNTKRQRRAWTEEMKRISEERNRYQKRVLALELRSSNK